MTRSRKVALLAVLIVANRPDAGHAVQPFQRFVGLSMIDGADNAVTTFAVPMNTTFVVESVSGRIALPAGQHLINAEMFTVPQPDQPPVGVLFMEPKLIAQNVPAGQSLQDIYLFNTSTRAYWSGTVTALVERAEINSSAQASFSANGYLIPSLTGDFNENGAVEGGDLLVWQQGLGSPLSVTATDADGDGNGTIDGGDLALWKAHFGDTAVASASMAPVPEPPTMTLSALAGSVLTSLRRRSEASATETRPRP